MQPRRSTRLVASSLTRSATSPSTFGGTLHSTNLDLILATLVALGLPPAAAWLLAITGGATTSLILYYCLCCVLLVRWRKGTLDYRQPTHWPLGLLLTGVCCCAVIVGMNWGNFAPSTASTPGVVFTALIWAPLNAAMEQLSWLYVLDAWRNRWDAGWLRWLGIGVGSILLLVLVTFIHILFWVRFLPNADLGMYGWVTIAANTVLTLIYVLLYYHSQSMWPVFGIHLIVDLQLVLLARYSIIPFL